VSASLDIGQALESSSAALKVNLLAGLVLTAIILAGLERLLRSEEGARQKGNQLRLTLEHMSQGIMLVTRELDIPIINGRCGQLLGLPPEWINNPPRFDRLMEHQIEQVRPHQTPVAGIAGSNPSESAEAAPARRLPVAARANDAEREHHRGSQQPTPGRQSRADLHRHYQTMRG
jgi:PAS domain-containing protein